WFKHSTKVIIFLSLTLTIWYIFFTNDFTSVTYNKWNYKTPKNIFVPQSNLTHKFNKKENHQKLHFQDGNLTHKFNNEVFDTNFPKEKENHQKLHFKDGNRTHKFNNEFYDTNFPEENHIVITTGRRSGSSFIGELFKQNPDVFYVFEPLKPLDILHSKNVSKDIIQGLGVKYLRKTMECNFDKSYINLLMRFLKQEKLWTIKRIFPDCSSNKDIKEKCTKRKNVVTKTVRIKSLEGLANNLGRNCTVILLIRDPRGVFNSRLQEKKEYKDLPLYEKEEDMKELCAINVEDLKFLSKIIEDKLPYIMPDLPSLGLVIYEDVALDPMKQVVKLYKHLQLPFHENVRKWILTHTNTSESHLFRRKKTYGTSRNSSDIPHKWRQELSFKDIKMVESIPECATLIQMLAKPNKLSEYWYNSR
ncbi:unnamed protein product, partial [Owenia fusiformis]